MLHYDSFKTEREREQRWHVSLAGILHVLPPPFCFLKERFAGLLLFIHRVFI